MKFKITIFLCLAFIFNVTAQQRTCGSVNHTEQMLKDPEFKAKYQATQNVFNKNYKALNNNTNARLARTTIEIPVAVHFPAGSESNRACLEALAQNQVDILNADFTAKNSDLSLWENAKTHFPNVELGNVDLYFKIATKNHPADTDNDLVEGGKAVTIGYNFGNGDSKDAKWAGYFNILIKEIQNDNGQQLLGRAILGDFPSRGGAIEINTNAFGSGEGCPGYTVSSSYNLGRTVTHEVGHYLNLRHTWGNGSCSSDDDVADTPNIDAATYECLAPGSVIMCGNKSLTMNFMDYGFDQCLYMFTKGQEDRMNAHLNAIVSQFKTNVLSNDAPVLQQAIKIYPNPVTDKLYIDLNITEETSVSIFNVLGKQVKSFKTLKSSFNIDTSALASGLYLLKINSENLTLTRKIIVAK